MKTKHLKIRLFSSILVMGSLLVTGCSDSDYDFNNIDATIGIGGDGLELPASNTDNIKLSEVLDLEENGSVVADTSTGFDYVFRQQGNDVEAAHPYISIITVARRQSSSSNITLSFNASARNSRAASGHASRASRALPVLHGEGDVFEFSYEGNKPQEVEELTAAEVSSTINLKVDFENLASMVREFDKITLTFPSYMKLAVDGKMVEGNTITLNNVSTLENLEKKIDIVGLDFTKKDALGELKIAKTNLGEKIQLTGKVHMAVETSNYSFSSGISSVSMKNNLSMSDIKITGATGKFNPTINLNTLGNVHISGIPDFLKDGNVVVDLYNPQIYLTLNSNLGIEGFAGGTLKSLKDGREIASVEVPEFAVKANGTTQVVICRNAAATEAGSDVEKVEVPNLSNLVKIMPDEITFQANARANNQKAGTFKLGYHGYEVAPSYSIDSPIAFAEDACIEYSDDLDGWNDDIKDLNMADGAYIQLSTQVTSCVPAYLSVKATPVDVYGREISKDELEVEITGEIKASADGTTPATSPLSVKIL
ncbi:MAG: hypothetical protein JJO71_27050 [Escherichia coli]|nr:hypothetical protein [Escherichia coli]